MWTSVLSSPLSLSGVRDEERPNAIDPPYGKKSVKLMWFNAESSCLALVNVFFKAHQWPDEAQMVNYLVCVCVCVIKKCRLSVFGLFRMRLCRPFLSMLKLKGIPLVFLSSIPCSMLLTEKKNSHQTFAAEKKPTIFIVFSSPGDLNPAARYRINTLLFV